MPILHSQVVVRPAQPLPSASAATDALGGALGAEPGRVWVRLQPLASGSSAENGTGLTDDALPVFVTVLQAHPLQDAQLVAGWMRRPIERLYVEYASPGPGRLAFGGQLVQ